jgi:hypothetical protein
MIFLEFEVLPHLDALDCNQFSRSQEASSFLHMSLIFFSKYLQFYLCLITIALKDKYYFPTTINLTMWWAMEPQYVLMVEVQLQLGVFR